MTAVSEPSKKEDRIQFRLSPRRKQDIERWAAESGRSLSELVLQAVDEKMTRDARDRWLVTVHAQDAEAFASFLSAESNHLPEAPWNEAREAAERISG